MLHLTSIVAMIRTDCRKNYLAKSMERRNRVLYCGSFLVEVRSCMRTIWNAACTYFSQYAHVGKRVLNWGFCEHLRAQYETTIWFLNRTTTMAKAGHDCYYGLIDLPTTHNCYATIKQDNSIVHLVTGNVPCTYQLNCTVGLLYSVSLMPRPHVGWSQDMRLVTGYALKL